MNYEYVEIPKIKNSKAVYEDGANVPTYIDEHECLCGSGTIEHHAVPGFSDNFIHIRCEECKKRCRYIEISGNRWKIYL